MKKLFLVYLLALTGVMFAAPSSTPINNLVTTGTGTLSNTYGTNATFSGAVTATTLSGAISGVVTQVTSTNSNIAVTLSTSTPVLALSSTLSSMSQIAGTNGSGTNSAGADVLITTGLPTGSVASGSGLIKLQGNTTTTTSGAGAQTALTIATLSSAGVTIVPATTFSSTLNVAGTSTLSLAAFPASTSTLGGAIFGETPLYRTGAGGMAIFGGANNVSLNMTNNSNGIIIGVDGVGAYVSSQNANKSIRLNNQTWSNASGTNVSVIVDPIYNQSTLSSASNTDLQVYRTQTSTSTGSQLLIDAGIAPSTSKFSVDNLGNAIFAGSITPSQTAGIVGTTTNNSANAGSVGEFTSTAVAVGSAVSLSTATATNSMSISLTAGDWDVEAIANFNETTSTVTARTAGLSSTSATLPADGSEGYCGVQSTLTSETNSIALTKKRFSLSGTTTIYLVQKATFSAGTCGGFGTLIARRPR